MDYVEKNQINIIIYSYIFFSIAIIKNIINYYYYYYYYIYYYLLFIIIIIIIIYHIININIKLL